MEASLTDIKGPQIPILLRTRSLPVQLAPRDQNTQSQQILDKIYQTIYSPSNHRFDRQHKFSLSMSIDDTLLTSANPVQPQSIISKCKCKKSKCLKLYCQCFSNGSFCKDCNCQGCHNTQQFSQIRAKAIDQVMVRATVPFGHKNSAIKGCNCKKTGCSKKYCECFGAGDKCSQYCKCENCVNC